MPGNCVQMSLHIVKNEEKKNTAQSTYNLRATIANTINCSGGCKTENLFENMHNFNVAFAM